MFKLSLNRVHDRIKINEGAESLVLVVDGDPMRMVAGILQAQKLLQAIDENSTDEQTHNAAQYFAEVIFGKEQTAKLFDFYRDDAGCVVSVCGKYFKERLSKMLDKAQRKAGVK